MRIIGVRPVPVALLFTFGYAVFGLLAFVIYEASNLQVLVLPIGFVFGVFHLTLNLPLARSEDLLANAFQCLGAVLCYALTGWITGIAFVLLFNFGAAKLGGIDAKFVEIAKHEPVVNEEISQSRDSAQNRADGI